MSEESEKKKSKLPIIIAITVVIILIIGTVGGYFGYQYIKENKTTGTEWGDTYYSYLKSVKEADEEKIKSAGLSKDIKTAQVQFVQVKSEDNPKMILTYQKDNESYTNIYFIGEEQKVNVISYNNPTTVKLLYNREAKEYMWYLYSKEQDKNSYKSLEKIMKEIKSENNTEQNLDNQETKQEQETEAEASYAEYTFKDDELKSNFEVADEEIPVISKFDEKFIETEIDDTNLLEINFEENNNKLRKELTETIRQYKTKSDLIEEVKTKTEEQEKILENKKEEIKIAKEEKAKKEDEEKAKAEEEAKKKQEEERARKVTEETNTKKAEENVTNKNNEKPQSTSTVQAGKYTLVDKARDGSVTIKNVTNNSIQFDISVVNLFGGYHVGQLSATAIKTSDNKYMYTTTEQGKTYKFYMEVNGNSIKVSTSKMLNGDGFDPFCGVNAAFDGTYTK